ncbi:hypothetical protein P3T76_005389 [Phytophthora citrophthora]|uniref:Uncharacterized protein n=1 Tax=Phytophthora citrophthora TaxID=4793 RepID=A0AAD9GTL8_9STRA|nr:hypothetical protein P3T76_005389 [Phytophthora citrophthora]
MQLLWALASAAALLASPAPVSGAAIDPKDKGEPLFPDGHPNITYLTDKNWDEHMAKTDKPWIVDFYHPLYVIERYDCNVTEAFALKYVEY